MYINFRKSLETLSSLTSNDLLTVSNKIAAGMHENLILYDCKEYFIDIQKLICVNKILHSLLVRNSDEN